MGYYQDKKKIQWRSFLLSLAFNERGIRKIKEALPECELLPHPRESFWVPREWRKSRKDLICVSLGGQEDPLDLFVHEVSHARWTWRSKEARALLNHWGVLFNLAEDARIEYLASREWGWVFKSWQFPPLPEKPPTQEEELLLWGLYIKKVSVSTGRDIPREWQELLKPVWETLRQAYQELTTISTEKGMAKWLNKYFPSRPALPPALSDIVGDMSPYNNDWERREEEGRKLLKEIGGGSEERGEEWFSPSIAVSPSPALISLLSRLAGERVERVNSLWGRYNPRSDLRGREDCFKVSRTLPSPEVVIVVDTSGSMQTIGKEVRELLWGIKVLGNKGTLRGKVLFVSGGRAFPLSLPTKLPIEKVVFSGGTNGYKNALPHIPQDAFVVFLSDLLVSDSDKETIRALGERAFFLYGGEEYPEVEKEARKLGLPRQRCFFAPTVREALEKLLMALGL